MKHSDFIRTMILNGGGSGGGGGGSSNEKGIVERSITGTYQNNEATKIGSYAFAKCASLTGISCANATSIDINAFDGCSALTSINLPKVTTIDTQAFKECTGLVTIGTNDMPSVNFIGGMVFYNCSNLESITLPDLEMLNAGCFSGCEKLRSVSFPSFDVAKNNYALLSQLFYNCAALTTIGIDFSNIKTLGTSVFYGCGSLTELVFPAVNNIGASQFNNCVNLEYVDFQVASGAFSAIPNYCFAYCSSLKAVALRKTDSVITLQNKNAFTNAGDYKVLVPNDLVNTYKTTGNWSDSAVVSHIYALEDYTVDGTTTGAIDKSKF